jgi:hypothetical protein
MHARYASFAISRKRRGKLCEIEIAASHDRKPRATRPRSANADAVRSIDVDNPPAIPYILVAASLSGRNSAVECQLPKLDVTGSIPVARSNFPARFVANVSYRSYDENF